MKQSAESITAEAALVRSQLVAVGADIRRHADPAAIVDAAKTSFKRRSAGAPSFLKENATPICMVVLGAAFGAVVTGLFSRRAPSVAPAVTNVAEPAKSVARPSVGSQANAALLSSVGVGLGYVAGLFIPSSATEDRLLGGLKAVLVQHLDDFLKQHARGMKKVTANAFGLSRLSATTLVGLAMLADALGAPRRPATTNPL
jgi:hypothetical protein